MRRTLFIAMAFGAACVLPPPVSLEEGVNQHPYIDDAEPPDAEVDVNRNCDSFCFEVHADDPDPGDTLYFRWFWDYSSEQTAPAQPDEIVSPSLDGQPRLYNSYPFAPSGVFSTLTGSGETATHTLEVLVTDRAWGPSSQTPVNQALTDGGLSTEFRWTVNFIQRGTTCDTPSQCSE